MTRDEVFAELKQRGVEKVRISFSGGNDSGGPDQVTLLPSDTEAEMFTTHAVDDSNAATSGGDNNMNSIKVSGEGALTPTNIRKLPDGGVSLDLGCRKVEISAQALASINKPPKPVRNILYTCWWNEHKELCVYRNKPVPMTLGLERFGLSSEWCLTSAPGNNIGPVDNNYFWVMAYNDKDARQKALAICGGAPLRT